MLGKGVWMRGICVERKNKEVKKMKEWNVNVFGDVEKKIQNSLKRRTSLT